MSDVTTKSESATEMCDAAKLPRSLMGGTKAMRKAGVTYLPKDEAESADAYNARLGRSTLFNGFRKTVKDMTGKVFRREVQLGSDMDADLKAFAENIDLAGRHLNVFARDVFRDGMVTGGGYIFVDMPQAVKRADGKPATIADERQAGIRPYFCFVAVEDVLGWKSENINGVVTLTQFRFKERTTVPDGPFVERPIEQIRVLTPGAWEIWREAANGPDKGKWVKFSSGAFSIKAIPIAPVYINRTGFMTFEPPLTDLADLNVAHWQSSSDQRNILHVARVPILFGAGFAEDSPIIFGANTMVRTTDTNAKLEFVEHSGQAIEAGRNDLKDLELQMQMQGLLLLVAQPSAKTATGEMRDDEKENSPLAMMAKALQDALEMAFGFAARYMNRPTVKGGSVVVNTDFGVSLDALTLRLLLDSVNSGKLDDQTYLDEMKRRGVLADSVDVETVLDRIANAAPGLDAGAGKGMNLNGPPAATAA